MYGAVFGDIIGSTYELHNVKTEDFPLFPAGSAFTDDTVMTIAITEKLLTQTQSKHFLFLPPPITSAQSYALWFKQYYRRYPNAGYGQMFAKWALSENLNIQRSYGNGAAMRVSAIGCAFDSLSEVQNEVKQSCHYTHHHPEAIRGALAVATTIFLARKDCDKDEIQHYLSKKLHYKLSVPLDQLRDTYVFNSRTSYSVPPAIQAFLESSSYEDAILKAISIGGDSDTIACITGGIAHAYYKKIPDTIYSRAITYLDSGLKDTLRRFEERFHIPR